MTKTREVDGFGNVSYTVRGDDGQVIGRIAKTCHAWQAELPSGSWVPAASVKAGMEWFEFSDRILARPAVAT